MEGAYDALIVGAGPAGAAAALFLAQQNYRVAVIEARPQVKRKVCGEYLCPPGVTLLQRKNIFSTIAQDFLPVTGMDVFSPAGRKVAAEFPGDQRGLSVNRALFDQRLLALARTHGADIFFDQKVQSLEHTHSGWKALTAQENTFSAPLLIGADGRKSVVAKHMGVQLQPDLHRMALHTYIDGRAFATRQGEMHLFADGSYIGINPIHSGEANISLVTQVENIKTNGSPVATFNHYISQSENLCARLERLQPLGALEVVTPVHHRVSRTAGADWALIGDAAGFVDPITGEGIYNALATAEILAQELGSLSENQDLALALRRYQKRRARSLQPKARLNQIFQWLIRHPHLIENVAAFLQARSFRASVFMGIVGNVYSPARGILKLFTN